MASSRRLSHALAVLLLAAALFTRALVPSGWMPVSGTDGLRIALCTGEGPVTLVMEADGSVHREAPQDRQDIRDPCPYGVTVAKAFYLPSAAAMPLAPERMAALVAPALMAVRLVIWRSLRPPARGPPAFA